MSKKNSREIVNTETGEITEQKLNEVITVITPRPNGTLRIQQDFSNCPTMAEQHTAHLTDINYLIERYKPDELAAYLAARNEYRQEVVEHDFSQEPDLQEAKNIVARSRAAFMDLPDSLKYQFKSHLEFLKFIDIPQNADKLVKLGLLTTDQLNNLLIPEDPYTIIPNPNFKPPTQNQNSNQNPQPTQTQSTTPTKQTSSDS